MVALKLGIITSQLDQELERSLEILVSRGIKYVEVDTLLGKPVEGLSKTEAYKVKQLIDHYKIKVSNIASTLFFMCPLNDSSSVGDLSEPHRGFPYYKGDFTSHLNTLCRCIHLAELFETDKIRIFGFRKKTEGSIDKLKELLARRLEKAVRIAEKYKIILILENCHYTYLPTGALTWEVVQKIDSPNLRLLWDPGNTVKGGGVPFPGEYYLIRKAIAHVHVKNLSCKGYQRYEYAPADGGILDWLTIIHALHADGYKGVLSLEPSYSQDGSQMKGAFNFLESFLRILRGPGWEL